MTRYSARDRPPNGCLVAAGLTFIALAFVGALALWRARRSWGFALMVLLMLAEVIA